MEGGEGGGCHDQVPPVQRNEDDGTRFTTATSRPTKTSNTPKVTVHVYVSERAVQWWIRAATLSDVVGMGSRPDSTDPLRDGVVLETFYALLASVALLFAQRLANGHKRDGKTLGEAIIEARKKAREAAATRTEMGAALEAEPGAGHSVKPSGRQKKPLPIREPSAAPPRRERWTRTLGR